MQKQQRKNSAISQFPQFPLGQCIKVFISVIFDNFIVSNT